MRWIDWIFIIGVIALIVGPLMTLRIIAKADKRRTQPPAKNTLGEKHKAAVDEDED